MKTILSNPFKAEFISHDNGVRMLIVSRFFGTHVLMLSPVWHFDIASGKHSEATMLGPFTYAHSNVKAVAE